MKTAKLLCFLGIGDALLGLTFYLKFLFLMKTSALAKAGYLTTAALSLYGGTKALLSDATLPPAPIDVITQWSATPVPPTKTVSIIRSVSCAGISILLLNAISRDERKSAGRGSK